MRVVVRTLSELCITVGTLICLFVVYVLFWTGVRADGAMNHQIDVLHDQWSKQTARPKPTAGGTGGTSAAPARPAPYVAGRPFAIMYIPRLGFTWNKPVLENTEVSTLKKGLGTTRTPRSSARWATSRWPDTGAPTAIPSWTSPGCGPGTRSS